MEVTHIKKTTTINAGFILITTVCCTKVHKINTQNVNAHLLKLFFGAALYVPKECFYLVGNADIFTVLLPNKSAYFLF